jgi:transcriptional regulator with XRE-family HTH domain
MNRAKKEDAKDRLGQAIAHYRSLEPVITQMELAKKAGISRSALSQYEAGRSAPTCLDLDAIATALGTTAEALMSFDPENPPKTKPQPIRHDYVEMLLWVITNSDAEQRFKDAATWAIKGLGR